MKKMMKSLIIMLLFTAVCIYAQDDIPADNSPVVSENPAETDNPDGIVSNVPEDNPEDVITNSTEDNSTEVSDTSTDIGTDNLNDEVIVSDGNLSADMAEDVFADETADSSTDVTVDITDENQNGDDYYKLIDDDTVVAQTPVDAEPGTDLKKVYGRVIYVDSSEIVLKYGKKEYYFKCLKDMTPGLEICQTAEIYYYTDDKVMIAEKFVVIKESSCYSKK